MTLNRLAKLLLRIMGAAVLLFVSQNALGGLILSNIPAVWGIHYVTNTTKPLMTMYTGGGEPLSEYQAYTAAMLTDAPKGMGNAFDPGPSWGIWNAPQWEWLASNGFPSTTYSAIFLTNAVSDDDLTLLSILDDAGLFTSVQFGEWGYHFHTDEPYGPYDGYPVQETNKVDCYNFLEYAYQQQTATYRLGWANSTTGHSHYECYADEWGCRMGGIEVGENIAFTQSKFAFARGASRQWGVPWSVQVSPWWDGYCTTWQTPDYGHSLSLYQRLLSHGWFAGAAWLTPENSSDIVFNNDDPTQGTNNWGVALAQLYAFINSHDRGVPYTPVAVVLDHYAGYNGYEHLAWGTLPFTAGDEEIDDLFVNQLFPGSDFIHYNPFPGDQELGYLRETPYGEIFDVLLSSATATNLASYPVILLVGDITFDEPFISALQQALQSGTQVLMQPSHQAALGAAFVTLTNAGTVEVLPLWTNPVTGRAAAIPNSRLAQLASNCLPIAVSGDPIQYSINRNAAGWVIELVHDNGVWKDPTHAAVITNSDIAMVTLQPSFQVANALQWQIDSNGNAADVNLNYTGAPLTVPVGPGQSVYVQFSTQITNTLTIGINGTGSVLTGGSNAPSTILVPAGQTVSLTAQGNFVAWTGSQTNYSTNVQIVMTTNLSITANFQDGSTPLAPFIVTQPVAQTLPVGGNLALSVAGCGIPAPTFSWSMGGQSVGNGTSNLTITNLTTTNQGDYSCLLSNSAGTVQSTAVLVKVEAVPSFITEPVSQIVLLGRTATFTAEANSSNVTWQWFKSTNALAGRTNTSLGITNVQLSNLGSYSVVITNAALSLSATSSVVTLTEMTRPVISAQPSGTNVILHSNATLSVTAGGGNLSYIWKAGANIQSSTSNSCPVNSSIAGTFEYIVIVSNAAGTATSSAAKVVVVGPPVINTKPKSQSLIVSKPLSLSVVAAGARPYTALSYQWQFGTNIANATNSTFEIAGISSNWAGTFTVVVSNFGGTNSASAVIRVVPDTSPPKLAVNTPTRAVTNSPFTLTGTARDLIAVTNVAFSLDGGADFTNAVTTNSWTNWSAVMPLVIGTNTVMVVAADINGLTATNIVKIKYVPFFTAVLTTAGSGTGTVAGFSDRMQYGVSCTLTAKPSAQNLFQSWSGLSGISTTNSTNSAKFLFTVTNNVAITVSFATNLFFDQAGAYNGLFYQSSGATHDSAGFLHVTITTNLSYSGKVLLDGQIFNISGEVDTNGEASVALDSDVTLVFGITNQQLIGTVSSSGWTAPLTADLAAFSKANPNNNFDGNFDIVIPPASAGPATNGYGFGTVAVSTNGTVTFVGSTADGSALSQSVPVSQDGNWPLFVQIYPINKTNTAGEILGWITFPTNGAPTGTLSWIKTGYSSSGPYANGLTNTVSILSSTYLAPTKSSPCVLNGLTTGEATFAGGNLISNIDSEIAITNNGAINCFDHTMTMKFISGGLFTGKYLDNGTGQEASFFGAALQNTTNGCGYFLGTDQSGSFTLVPIPLTDHATPSIHQGSLP